MKKILIFAVALLSLSFAAQAQSSRDRLSDLENKELKQEKKESKKKTKLPETSHRFFQVKSFNDLCIGWHMLSSPEYNNGFAPSRELVLSVANINISPVNWFSVSAGVSAKMDRFQLSPAYCFLRDAANDIAPVPNPYGGRMESYLSTVSLAIPVQIGISAGGLGINVGADYLLKLPKFTKVSSSYEASAKNMQEEFWGVDTPAAGFDFFVALSFKYVGVYAKYTPAPVVPGYNGAVTTLGLKFTL